MVAAGGCEADDRTGQHGKSVEAFAAALRMSSKNRKDAEWAQVELLTALDCGSHAEPAWLTTAAFLREQ
jgi:hypothetical protein